MRLVKYHALGNDYLAVSASQAPRPFTRKQAQYLCNRKFGAGADGILQQREAGSDVFGLTIYNSDGSLSEKSGNGLRIFARFLRDEGMFQGAEAAIETESGPNRVRFEPGRDGEEEAIAVNMGVPTFRTSTIPVKGTDREMVEEPIVVEGAALAATAVGLGNPHCVVFRKKLDLDEMRRLGPKIEKHSMFPNGTNVQFAEIVDERNVRALVWERGSGETLSSGSSACAVAAAGLKTRRLGARTAVHMPGGSLSVERLSDGSLELRGPVARVADIVLSREMLERLEKM